MLRLLAVTVCLFPLLVGASWAEEKNGQGFKLKLETRFIRFAVWSSGKVERYVAVPHSGTQVARYPAVSPAGIDAIRECLSQESFFDLPTNCGTKPSYTGNIFVVDYEGDVGKHRVEVVNLNQQPANDEVARFQRIWRTAFKVCLPSVKIEDYEDSVTSGWFPKAQILSIVGSILVK